MLTLARVLEIAATAYDESHNPGNRGHGSPATGEIEATLTFSLIP